MPQGFFGRSLQRLETGRVVDNTKIDPNLPEFSGWTDKQWAKHLIKRVPALQQALDSWGSVLIPSVRTIIFRDVAGSVYIPFDPKSGFVYLGHELYSDALPASTLDDDWRENRNYDRGTHALSKLLQSPEFMASLDLLTKTRLQRFVSQDLESIKQEYLR